MEKKSRSSAPGIKTTREASSNACLAASAPSCPFQTISIFHEGGSSYSGHGNSVPAGWLQTRRPQLHAPHLSSARDLQGNRRLHGCGSAAKSSRRRLAAAAPSDGMLRGKWWEIYQDPQLNLLEDRIAANNQKLAAVPGNLPQLRAIRSPRPAPACFQLFPATSQPATTVSPLTGRRPAQPPTTTTSSSAVRQAGSRTSGAASAVRSKQHAKPRRPMLPTPQTSISVSMPKWPPTIFSWCAVSIRAVVEAPHRHRWRPGKTA